SFYSGGDDGFVILWKNDGVGEHFQVSDLKIKMIAVSPNGNDIAIYETDDFSVFRVSVWNWKTKSRKFAKRFSDSIASLNYTAKGSYLMVGTSSIDGLLFLDSSRGSPLSVIHETTGVIKAAMTGKSEKNVMTYDQKGLITYYSLTNGSLIKEVKCESNLENPMFVHNNGRFLVGMKDKKIIFINTNDGLTENETETSSGMLVNSDSNDLYYVEYDQARYCMVLRYISLDSGEDRFNINLVKSYDNSDQKEASQIIMLNGYTFFGTKDGSIYFVNASESRTIEKVSAYTEARDFIIKDFEIIDNNYFMLTENKLLTGFTLNTEHRVMIENIDAKNISSTSSKDLVLWSKDETKPVYLLKYNEGTYAEPVEIYTPATSMTSLNIYKNTIVFVTGKSLVSIYDIETGSIQDIYEGSGLQDAIIFDNGNLYCAKTSVTNPNSALIEINVQTKETVPLPVFGEITFALANKKTNGSMLIYGISNGTNDQGKKKTEVFSYNPSMQRYTSIISWADEDTQAFLRFLNGIMYTNIGKSSTRSLDMTNKKTSTLKRSASLPKKITGNNTNIATLNKDGSITWYQKQSNAKLESWYFSANGSIVAR
nr:hypothetical protein [Treponemataceae bacterium]